MKRLTNRSENEPKSLRRPAAHKLVKQRRNEKHLLTAAEVVLTLGFFAYSPPDFVTPEGVQMARQAFAEFMEAAQEGGFTQASLLIGLVGARRLSSQARDLAEAAVLAAGNKGARIFGRLERQQGEETEAHLH